MELANDHFRLGGRPFFLYAGEIHYFRIPRGSWTARLQALKRHGFNTVSTYIPWIWHEPREGSVDLRGRTRPETDVLGFIDLARRMGIQVLARVGPISNAELANEGLPDWLSRGHPELFIVGRRDVGGLPHTTCVSYLNPVFLEKTGRWYDALLPELARRQAGDRGNIIGVQLCNEIAMVHWLQKGADHAPHVNALFRRFLQDKYGDLKALNEAQASAFRTWDEVPQPDPEAAAPDRMAAYVDWALFYRRYYATYYAVLAGRARDRGITAPLFANIPQFYDYDIRGRGNMAPMTTSMFRDFPLLTPGVVFGGAYQMRHLDFENFHDVALTTEVTRMLSTVAAGEPPPPADPRTRLPPDPAFSVSLEPSAPVFCAELQTGILKDRPRLYPHVVDLNLKASVGQGLAGVNAYMFAGGRNPEGLGAFGAYHDWQAPVGPDGEVRPHAAPLRDFGRFLKWAGPLLAATRKVTDATLGIYPPYHMSEYWSGPWAAGLEGRRWSEWYDGLARLLMLAGYSLRTADLLRDPPDVLALHPSLWVYGLDMMDRATQAKLAGYVKEGGRLFLGPRLPVKDLRGAPETLLADELGVSVAGQQAGNLFSHAGRDWWVGGPVQTYASADGRPLVPLGSGAAVLEGEAGRGRFLLAGFGLPHMFDHFRDWVRGWGERLGVSPLVRCEPWDMQAVLRAGEDWGFLFLYNYHFTERGVAVRLPLPGGGALRLPARGTLPLPPLSARVLPLHVPIGKGCRLVYTTAQPLEAGVRSGSVRLVLAEERGRNISVGLRLPRRPRRVTGGRAVRWRAGRLEVAAPAAAPETRVRIDF